MYVYGCTATSCEDRGWGYCDAEDVGFVWYLEGVEGEVLFGHVGLSPRLGEYVMLKFATLEVRTIRSLADGVDWINLEQWIVDSP